MARSITEEFREKISELGREIEIQLFGSFPGNYLYGENINSFSYHFEGDILKSVMYQLDIDSKVNLPVGTIIVCSFGLKIREQPIHEYLDMYEWLQLGFFKVYSNEYQEATNSYKLVCYDYMLNAMKDYETPKINGVPITYPISVRDYINAICQQIGLNFGSNNSTFTNYNKMILSEPYLQYNSETEEWSSLGYTFRDVLDELAQVTASTITVFGSELILKYINETDIQITEEQLKDINVNFGEMTKPINTITFKRSADADIISVSYPQDLPDNQKNEIVISDNQILNGNNRDEFIDGILERLYGLTYCINDFSSTGIVELELCDKYNVVITKTDDEGNTITNTYPCIMFNDEINISQGLEELIHTEKPEDSTTDYTKSDTTDRRINQTYLIVDKQNQTIQSVVSQTGEQNTKISQLTQKVDELESQISEVADLTTSGETRFATLSLENINESEPVLIKVYPIVENISCLYPRSNLYPSSSTYLKTRKIRFHNNTTNENFDYELPDDLLYYDGEHFDEFNLGYGEQICTITKKCEYDANGNVVLKQTPITNTYTYPTISLTDGDYTISLLGYSNGYIFARLMAQNLYTDQFYTKVETNSIINQTAQSIDLGVNTKLTNYSTTNEMNSAISLKANEITSSVNNTLTNYSTTTQMNSAISQKANEITSEVSETYATKDTTDTLSSRISQTAKGISLQVNNGSTSSGITITTTKEDGSTSTASGTITMNGLVKFTDLSTSGATTINGANIQTGTLSASKITTGTLNASRVTVTNLNASNINTGTINGRPITNSQYTYKGVVEHIRINDGGDGMIEGYYSSSGTLNNSTRRYAIASFNAGGRFQTFDSSGTMGAYFSQRGASDVISDKRVKKNIKKIDEKQSLDIINNLNPVKFNYKKKLDDDKIVHRGLIAQEVEQTLKQIGIENQVYEINEDGRYLLNYIELIPDLINCIKYLKQKIEKLESESDK